MNRDELHGKTAVVKADCAFWALVEVTREVLQASERLVSVHPLRTLDAMHVASAMFFATRLGTPGLTFVSADMRQLEAAQAVGLVARRVGD